MHGDPAAWVKEGGRLARVLLLGAREARAGGLAVESDEPVELGIAREARGQWQGEILLARAARVRVLWGGEPVPIAGARADGDGWVRLEAGRHAVGE